MTGRTTAALSVMIPLLVILITVMVMNPLAVILVAILMSVVFSRISSTGPLQNSGANFPLATIQVSSSSPSSPSVAASSCSRSWKYDVFLSFRGKDTRKTFVDHLYSALVERVTCTYKDDVTLSRGDTIGPSLFKAIEESQIAIIIFSENYADSSWCLDELTYIMKCNKEGGKIVMPIFYHVDPSDVRNQKNKFGEAFAKHGNNNKNKVESWRKALVAAGSITGWEINHNVNEYEAKCIKDIVGTLLDRLLYSNSAVDEKLVGMGTRLQDLKLQLKMESHGARMIGIWGIGGGGKTTLAFSLYTEISCKFDSCCFVENIKEESSMKTLQEKILSTVLKIEVKVDSVDQGKQTIKTRLSRKNVLLVLDDIDDRKQLEALAGSHDWFGDGSRIIITTRNEQLLRAHRVDGISHVSLLLDEEAIRLFYMHAYNVVKPIEDYKKLSQRVVSYCAGLPLALIVLGSFLYDKNNEEWISTLDRLKDIPEMEIMKILMISYDGLTPLEKELFLDIACFWRGKGTKEKYRVMEILDACGFHPRVGVKVLIQKGLITISSKVGYFRHIAYFDKYDVFEMHDLVQEMGHYIVRGENPNNPEKHSRLWQNEKIKDICCTSNATTENNITEAIVTYTFPSTGFGKFLSKAKKLRMLYVSHLDKTDIVNKRGIEMPEYLSNELRYLYWNTNPASPFPESFQLRKLVVLRLKHTLQEELWKDKKDLPCLKELEVSYAINLVRTPDFGGLPCLQKLTLVDCPKLMKIEGNFNTLKNLHKCTIHGPLNFINWVRKPTMLTKDQFHEHIHLEELHIICKRLPCNFYLPRFIRRLTLKNCEIEDGEIPLGIGELSNLQELDLSTNGFSVINFSFLKLTRLKLLNLTMCMRLVEIPKLPTSIAILRADYCSKLEVVEEITYTNCKWLCYVSLCDRKSSVTGGDKLLQTMLQGNAIENGCMMLHLSGVEIPKGFRPRLLRGDSYLLKLPENWFNHFSGFLLCTVAGNLRAKFLSMKHYKGGKDCQHDFFFEDGKSFSDVDVRTRVVYVSFGLLKHTSWWDTTSTAIQFSFHDHKAIGVRMVSKTNETNQLQTTTDSSSDDDYKFNFYIKKDSRSHLECEIQQFTDILL